MHLTHHQSQPLSLSQHHTMLALRQAKRQPFPLTKLHHRTFIDTPIKHVRDKGLDHAITHFRHLKPLINLKNLIKSQPSKTLPLSMLNYHKLPLSIPFRPLDFTRLYPSVFTHHTLPNSVEPLIGLTPEVSDIDSEEMVLFQSDSYKRKLADRLVKLVMIGKVNKVPLRVVDRLKWDLGLPIDYVESIVPAFPDYFRVCNGELELVCWVSELARSVVEGKGEGGEFKMMFSSGFEVDKKYKKWLEEWKKLPYLSPYEFNGVGLAPRSDESDKWVVGVLHEVLSLFVTKRTDRENLFCVGEWLGVRARVRRALIHHPGIFYTSSRLGTNTVVLKEGFKRGMLVESDELMSLRSRYLHLMHTVKEEPKRVSVSRGGTREQKKVAGAADSETDDEADDVADDFEDNDDITDSEEEDEEEKDTGARNRVRSMRKTNLNVKGPSKGPVRNRSGVRPREKLHPRGGKNLKTAYNA